jgi:hypothetical protein
MTDRLLTPGDLTGPGPAPKPGLFELRMLERRLRERVRELDLRVDEVLVLDGPPTGEQVARVDVLCAAIGEARELLDEVRREAAAEVQDRRARRARPRRWE